MRDYRDRRPAVLEAFDSDVGVALGRNDTRTQLEDLERRVARELARQLACRIPVVRAGVGDRSLLLQAHDALGIAKVPSHPRDGAQPAAADERPNQRPEVTAAAEHDRPEERTVGGACLAIRDQHVEPDRALTAIENDVHVAEATRRAARHVLAHALGRDALRGNAATAMSISLASSNTPSLETRNNVSRPFRNNDAAQRTNAAPEPARSTRLWRYRANAASG